MKKIITMAVAALFITVATSAQIQRIQDSTFEKNRPHQKMMVKDNWNNLNLTDAQKKQMKENQESLKKQRDAVKNDASLTQEQKKSKMMEIQKASMDKNNKILTEDQRATMKANRKDRQSMNKGNSQQKMKGKKGKGMNDRGMNGQGKAMNQLNLSQEQQSKMKDLRTTMQEQTQAINKNTKLTEDQRKEQIKELRAKNREQMNQLLTPEQKLQMKEKRGNSSKENTRMKKRKQQSQ